MKKSVLVLASGVLLAMIASPAANAQSLLGVDATVGDTSVSATVGITSNSVDSTVTTSSGSSVSASVFSGDTGTGGTIGTNGLGGVDGSVTLSGADDLLTGSVGAGDASVDVGLDLGLGIGGPGVPGPAGIGTGGFRGSGAGAIFVMASLSPADVACMGPDAASLLKIAQHSSPVDQWARASNVQIVRIEVCPDARLKLLAAMRGSGLGSLLWGAAAQDALIVASLSRSPYSAENVLAVQRSGNQLTVYVI